ncbi:sarcosine oxidase subunit delta [Ruegeria marina]|uniref:Sarcosine oxidase subunit delta n=1 Tax=Ruegeria marina TaxID=639004 RepID=A0A1G7DQX1_9RHOB|nr:sarcosine oxidase subunit delta [Ruegeria marina]SDE53908.1 sarcosine oxidase subunit delta [Ruegeria marina]
MIRIHCPICGQRSETEFSYYGDATVKRPDEHETDPALWVDYVFTRDNPRGWHREYWHHVQGCRQWLVLERNTLTHEVSACHLASEASS